MPAATVAGKQGARPMLPTFATLAARLETSLDRMRIGSWDVNTFQTYGLMY
jgi:hypothetical protein